MKTKKLFYTNKMDTWDYSSLCIYFIISVLFYFDPNGIINKEVALGYSFGTPLFLYFFNYKSLRKLNVWGIWFGISLIHLFMYKELVGISKLQYFRGSAVVCLQYTWVLLLLFQFLRIISLKIQNMELVAPSKFRTDIWDNRNISLIDFACFIVYIFILMYLDV